MTTTSDSYWKSIDEVRRYGRYLLLTKLAEGGMAEIFLAKQVGPQGFERDVVVKRMLKHLGTDPEFVSMFLDEARLAARLFHPSIVQINDLGVADGQYFICMEYLPGEDLAHVIAASKAKKRQIPVALACRIIHAAAEGLHFAHDFVDGGKPLNIVHRDVTPSNILVTFQGNVKVVDFGIAKAETKVAKTTAGAVKGKWSYMSPEQARADALDRRSDVFSLGLTFYELLTQTRPFKRENELAILKAVLFDPIQDPRELRPDLPDGLVAIIGKALTRDLAQRYQSAAELANDIEGFLASTTSGLGSSQLSQMMSDLFGPDRAQLKTQVPTIAQLAAMGVKLPADLGDAGAPPAAPSVSPGPATVVTRPAPAPLGEAAQAQPAASPRPKRSRALPLIIGGSALVALGVGGALLVPRLFAPTPAAGPASGQQAVNPTPPAEPNPAQPATSPTAQVAPTDVAEADAERPAKEPQKTVARPRPVERLSGQVIAEHVARSRARLLECFEQNRAALPSGDGKVTLTFTILRSGSVSSANVDSPGGESGPLSRCIVRQVKAIRFPSHKDNEVTVSLPFLYKVSK